MTIAEEITITVSRDVVKATSKGGAVGYNESDFDSLRLATIQAFQELLLEDMINDVFDLTSAGTSGKVKKRIGKPIYLKVLGRQLYAALFSKPMPGEISINQLLNDKLAQVEDERLRLQLMFDTKDLPHPDWINLPWEFLYSADRQNFLSTDFNLVLSRYLELGKDREEFDPGEEPLKLLVVVSRPADEGAVIAKEVLQKIQQMETGSAGTSGVPKANIIVQDLKQPNRQALKDKLKEFKPHVLHFIGHGKYDPDQKIGELLLVKQDTEEAEPLNTEQLLATFNAAQCYPRLVFLHMCEGGISESDATTLQAFSGFAPSLINAKIPTVVAMQYPIKNAPARDFSLKFYDVLASGGSVDEAVQEGRYYIDQQRSSLVFGTPVLFMHSAEGLVLPPPKLGEGAEIAGGAEDDANETDNKETPSLPAVKLPAADAGFVGKIIKIGMEAIDETFSGEARKLMIARLFKVESQLAQESSSDIFSHLFNLWEEEDDPKKKAVWRKMFSIYGEES